MLRMWKVHVCVPDEMCFDHIHTHTFWLEWYGESTAHICPILLFGTSKRCQGFETDGMVGMSAVTGFRLVHVRGCTGVSGLDNLPGEVEQRCCLKQMRTMGLMPAPRSGATFNHRLPNSSDTDSRNSVPTVGILLYLGFSENSQS